MNRTLLSCVLLTTSFTPACSGANTNQTNNLAAKPAASQAAKADEGRARALEAKLAEIVAEAKGRVGVAAVVLETGEKVSLKGREQFPMQSVYKLPIGMAVLRLVDGGKVRLDQKVKVEKSDYLRPGQHSLIRDRNPQGGAEFTIEELIRLAIEESDGVASDVLMRVAGGAGAVAAFLNEIKVPEMMVLNTEKEIGRDWETQYRNWASPEGAVELLRALHERRGLSESSQRLMLKFLTDSKPGAQRLKGLLPAGTVVAHKTGTGGVRGGVNSATNDIGIITLPNGKHAAVAVFVSDTPTEVATREGVIAKVAKAVWDAWAN